MLDLSVIVPIYNTPLEALKQCFQSIGSLPISNYEVLLIDDGSGPAVGEFCNAFVSETPRFRYIYKENGGVSSARNLGLSLAQGRYITFLDADDALLGEVFTSEIMEKDQDLVIFDLQLVENSTAVWSAFNRPSGDIAVEDLLRTIVADKSLNGPVGKLYKRELIADNNILFDETFVNGEDWDFVCRYCMLVKSVYYEKACCYSYFRDGGTSKSRINRFPDVVLSNVIAMYDKKVVVIDAHLGHCADKDALHSTAAAMLIEALFNSAAELYILKKLTPERKKLIVDTCTRAAEKLLPDASKKTKIKYSVLKKCFFCVYPLAHMREFYLKHKR